VTITGLFSSMSSKRYSVRRGTREDAAGVARVWVQSWNESYAGLLTEEELARRTVEVRAQHWRNAFAESNASLWVAEEADRIVGFAVGGPTRDEDLDPGLIGEVSAIYLVAPAIGKGIGRELLERTLDDLRAAGMREAVLWVLDENRRARAFYEKWGWWVDGSRKDCFGGVGAPVVRYRKKLDHPKP
jgi:L-amino acid N-acyltransferase YncA